MRGAVSAILATAESLMRRAARWFGLGLLAFAALYPLLVREEFGWLFSASLALIIGASTLVQYSFGSACLMLLEADQRLYVHHLLNIGATVANTLAAALLLRAGCGLHAVKLGSALVYCANPLLVYAYVRRHYALPPAAPEPGLLRQRRDAFFQELASFVTANTDILVLTICADIRQVSVYATYALVTNAMQKLICTATASVGSAFGDLLARRDPALETHMRRFETAVFSAATVCLSCTAALIAPFVRVYTRGITDVSYDRPVFGALMAAAAFFACTRQPYQTLTYALGHFRQTRGGAIAETALNLGLSLALVWRFGPAGVAAGTLLAYAFRTLWYARHLCRVFQWRLAAVWGRLAVSALCAAGTAAFAACLPLRAVSGYGAWCLCALAVFLVSAGVTAAADLLFYRGETLALLRALTRRAGKPAA